MIIFNQSSITTVWRTKMQHINEHSFMYVATHNKLHVGMHIFFICTIGLDHLFDDDDERESGNG